ncbi:hypothetical protein [Thiorhodovibrio frisius]|uniref:Uncharacterized protein n=1 Tax=Thiorhodovibrio frisius TaxID=631362 RepID=H8Z8K7_9GAMM|nr:hypothetical protein [Thiorhodovibrio frisius]EIC19412.1 hypothetical protein Thi970DRAFT_04931 [Thiorhodovibrio frisius]WPL22286.1 hypothetical protein Thiofri_02446 [Thiorhodovibrio frisius]
MHANHRPGLEQQKQIQRRAEETDSYAFFNVLTSSQLLDGVEALLPAHRERVFPPTETLSITPCRSGHPGGNAAGQRPMVFACLPY